MKKFYKLSTVITQTKQYIAKNNLYSAQKNALNLYKEDFDNSIDVYKVIGNK